MLAACVLHRQAGRIMGRYADGMDFKNAYVVLDSPESVPQGVS